MLGHEHLAVARAALGADPQADLDSGLAAAVLRQAVHQRGSVPRARLLAEAAMLLTPLTSDAVDVGDILERDLEALLAVGELVLRQPTPGAHVHVDPARPTFVQVRLDGDEPFLIAGGSVDGRPVLPPELDARVVARGRARWIAPEGSAAELRDELSFYGLQELTFKSWAQAPRAEAPSALVAPFRERASEITPERVASLEVFDPTTESTYYRRRIRRATSEEVAALCAQFRWIPARDTSAEGYHYSVVFCGAGGFTAASIGAGVLARDAWLRLAAAACHGSDRSRTFRCERDAAVLRLFFPPPSWLDRLLSLGAPVSAGGLCAYRVPQAVWPVVEQALTDVAFATISQA